MRRKPTPRQRTAGSGTVQFGLRVAPELISFGVTVRAGQAILRDGRLLQMATEMAKAVAATETCWWTNSDPSSVDKERGGKETAKEKELLLLT